MMSSRRGGSRSSLALERRLANRKSKVRPETACRNGRSAPIAGYVRRTSGFIPGHPGDNRAANSGAWLACPATGEPCNRPS
jgi:hypothetical protein